MTTTTTTEVSFPSHDKSFNLYGDLTLPAGEAQVPAILIISGSGPIDRHGNVPGLLAGLALNTHNKFAQQFTANNRQMAVLAYDKRGVGKSQPPGDKNAYFKAGVLDLVLDAVQAVEFLVNHPRIDGTKIIVMGHSEGAILIPLIHEQVQNKEGLSPLKGCIFLAGLGEDIYSAIQLQQDRALEEVNSETGFKGWILRRLVTKEKLDKQIKDMMDEVDKNPDLDVITKQCGLSKIPAKWFREHKQLASPPISGNVTCHCLAITGCKDLQVRNCFCEPDTAKQLLSKAASVESYRPEHLTHALRCFPDVQPKLLDIKKDYTKMGKQPVDEELVSTIGTWCDRIMKL